MNDQHGELVKRFVAPSMRRALAMVSEELGPEAVILSSQKTARGVEIVVSLEPDYATRGVDVRREFGQNFDAELDAPMRSDSAWRVQAGMEKAAETFGGNLNPGAPKRSPETLAREIEAAREKMMAAKRAEKLQEEPIGFRRAGDTPTEERVNISQEAQGQSETTFSETLRSNLQNSTHTNRETASQSFSQSNHNTQFSDEELKLHSLQSEIADMRLLLEQQLWRMSESGQQNGQVKMPGQFKFSTPGSSIGAHLERLGLHKALIDDLQDAVSAETRPSLAWRNAMAILSRRIPVVENDLTARGGVFAFVGPTGVGKTTTIAKLAARFVLQHGPGKVAIVTTDTWRVGAHDQLRSLGRILGVPVRVADKENSMVSVLASLKKFPLVLVDTAGFRHGDPMLKAQLKVLDSCPFMKRVLVLACNSQYQNLKASIHAYSSQRKVDACVLSKLDETASLGESLSVVTQEGLPLAYITNGQEIPADIETASGHGLVAKAVALLKPSAAEQKQSAFEGGLS